MTLLGKMVKDAKASGSGEFIRDGIYVFLVERIIEQKGYEGECCIAEFRVVTAEALDEKVKPNPPGSTCSVIYNVTKNREAALGNIKKLMMGLYGVAEDEVSEELYGATVGDANPSRGMLIGCRTRRVINKGKVNPANRGMEMTVPGWETVEQDEASVAKRCAELDAAAAKAASAANDAAKAKTDAAPAATTQPAVTSGGPAKKAGLVAGILGKKT